MKVELSQQLAQHDWGSSLEPGSVQVLDAQRGTWACTVTMDGKQRYALCWNALRMLLTPEEAEAFTQWAAQQQQRSAPALDRSQSEQRGAEHG